MQLGVKMNIKMFGLSALCGSVPLSAFAQGEFSVNLAVTSDYIWRGVSQTLGDPAVQGGLLPGALSLRHAAGSAVRVLTADVPELRCRQARIVAFITEAAPVERILACPSASRPSRHRLPPARERFMWDDGLADAVPDWDALAQPEPEYLFDRQVQW